ncbi:MAG TPA: hypothetical protein VHC42_10600 [Rhizomicrobium sp.]|nr:hypothetical protein [Rhizomicrobium sp.]
MDMVQSVVGLAWIAGAPLYLALQPWALLRFEAGWRKAAAIPLLGAAPTILWSAFALARQSNLWPLPFLLFAPLGAFYLVLLAVARRSEEA